MTLRQVVCDFETASSCDLKTAGAWRYSEDPTTEILCFNWREVIEGVPGRPGCWRPDQGAIPASLCDLVNYTGAIVWIAHNAMFEKAIWRNVLVPTYGMPDIPDERWHDTMAVCAVKSIPLALAQALSALRLPFEKDTLGNKLTVGLSKPDKRGHFDRSDATLERVATYCASDVDAEIGLHLALGPLPRGERNVWLMDQEINQRGVRLDLEYVSACQAVVAQTIPGQAARFTAITGLQPTQGIKFLDWLNAEGLWIPDLKRETVGALIGDPDADLDDLEENLDYLDVGLPDHVREALELRREVNSTSIAKLAAMQACVCEDGRARGLLQYYAAGTGRWGGRLIQPQNFPRGTVTVDDKAPDPDDVVKAILARDAAAVRDRFGASPIRVVSGGLRHTIIASKGKLLGVGDYAGIEARIVLALAGQHDKTAMMAAGQDVYCDMAAQIYQRPINKKDNPVERATGKNAVLGCGFQMGWKTFKQRYARHMTEEFCKTIIDAYRTSWAPRVPELWRGLENAAIETVWTGLPHASHGVTYQIEEEWMSALLPSGRKLWYRNPQPVRKAMPWDKDDVRRSFTFLARKSGHLVLKHAFGGLLTENVVQGLARDILVFAMRRCKKEGVDVVLTVHDELVTEQTQAQIDSGILEQIMVDRPQWAVAIRAPIAVECWAGSRYRK